jgi:hypothetical protein
MLLSVHHRVAFFFFRFFFEEIIYCRANTWISIAFPFVLTQRNSTRNGAGHSFLMIWIFFLPRSMLRVWSEVNEVNICQVLSPVFRALCFPRSLLYESLVFLTSRWRDHSGNFGAVHSVVFSRFVLADCLVREIDGEYLISAVPPRWEKCGNLLS